MRYSLKDVPAGRLDLKDRTFRVTEWEGPEKARLLERSIETMGLLNPPAALPGDGGSWRIVCGFKRIEACRSLGIKEIRVRALSGKPDPLDLARWAIADNSFSRPLNLLERANAAALLFRSLKEAGAGEENLEKEAGALGLPGNSGVLADLQRVYFLPDSIKQKILSGRISLAMAVRLSALNREEAETFAEIFDTLRLGLNRQKEFLLLAKEIAIREDIGVRDVFSDPEFLDITGPEDGKDLPIQTKNARLYLQKRRFPALSKAREDFAENLKQLHLSAGASIAAPPFFEGNRYILHLPFSKKQDIREHQKTLDSLAENPALETFPGFKP
ncbi:conserved hypothetical protein [Candidatus Desulfarcum epimagneticum]|uniref:ParB-like N-terminal domain-containing protein n=1 Tax=uncultured Desulfobacteraceae bacterium TaxID=218296 RepID=A0A484HK68_9BACT|nr:conserved hypothetical protein [uncultured Desulfobacteraceae bacterium]